jgi:hypothetical protein
MGILNGPRVNFWGGIQTNVCTTNNSENIGGKNVVNLATATMTTTESDADLIEMIRTPAKSNAGTDYFTNGGWNYYGDHQVHYVDATVSSEGEAGAVAESGDLIGEPVYLLGSIDPTTGQGPFFGPVMVDIDPSSGQTTQIFVGGLQIGAGSTPKLLIRHDTVCSSHALGVRTLQGESDSPNSSAINGTFQLVFPKSSVTSYDTGSATLSAIMNDPKATGFVLRFCMFEMAPLMTTPELLAAYEANRNPSNPSSGRVIGTLGPSYQGEPDSCPPGRLLQNSFGGAQGYAILNPEKALLSIDTSSLLQKAKFRSDRTDFTGPIGANIDYGPISVDTGKANTASGLTFDARPTDYYKYGGIVDVRLKPGNFEILSTQAIALSGSKGANAVAIQEQPLRIYSNARNIYINEEPGGATTLNYVVSYLGGPLNVDTTFTLASSSSGALPNPTFMTFPATASAKQGDTTLSIPVSYNGNNNPGFEAITISGGGDRYFVNFRNYLVTGFGIAAGSTVTWEQAYENTLRYFYVIFPAMSLRIPLNDEGNIQATAPQIIARLSEDYFPTTLRMPITRSMSPSQTKLLEAFLNQTPWDPPSPGPVA